MSDFKVTGGCLCGGVKYEYTRPPTEMIACYCSMCRKALGAPFGVFVEINRSEFNLIKSDTLCQYKSSEDIERSFCGKCGGGVFDKASYVQDKIFVNAGSIDGDPGISSRIHIYVKSKANWVTINDGYPQFDKLPAKYEKK